MRAEKWTRFSSSHARGDFALGFFGAARGLLLRRPLRLLLRPRRRGHMLRLRWRHAHRLRRGSHRLRRRSHRLRRRHAHGLRRHMRRSPHRLRRRVLHLLRLRPGGRFRLPASGRGAAGGGAMAGLGAIGLGAAVSPTCGAIAGLGAGLGAADWPRAASWWVSVRPVWPRAIRSDPICSRPIRLRPDAGPAEPAAGQHPVARRGLARRLRRERPWAQPASERPARRLDGGPRLGAGRGPARQPPSAQQASARPARRGSPADARSAWPRASLRPAAERDLSRLDSLRLARLAPPRARPA